MSAHTIRVLCESKNTQFIVNDASTREPLFWWRGNDLRIELALAENGQHLTSADVGTISIAIKAIGASADTPVSMIKTLTSSNCDATFTSADWKGGQKQLCVAEWTRAEAALNAGEYVIIVSHDDSAGKRNTFLHARILVREDQHDSLSISAPPSPPTEYYTKSEIDALEIDKAVKHNGSGTIADDTHFSNEITHVNQDLADPLSSVNVGMGDARYELGDANAELNRTVISKFFTIQPNATLEFELPIISLFGRTAVYMAVVRAGGIGSSGGGGVAGAWQIFGYPAYWSSSSSASYHNNVHADFEYGGIDGSSISLVIKQSLSSSDYAPILTVVNASSTKVQYLPVYIEIFTQKQ